jgi:hypothetical protein
VVLGELFRDTDEGNITAQAVVEARAIFVGVCAPNKGPIAIILRGCDGAEGGRKKESC